MASVQADLCELLIHILDEKKLEQIEIIDFPVIIDSIQDGQAPQYTPYLCVENVLGIPKKSLVKAYILAKNAFFEALKNRPSGHGSIDSATGNRLQSLSKIMLLFDSEHQMAANTRKRLIQQSLLSAEDELAFLNVIFTSPLPRHTKSPVLWFHRRFVLQHLANRPSLQEEMDVIFKAGERHPKNYYAWMYARWAWETLWPESQWGLPQLAYGIRAWCMAHVGDISGWTFFLWFSGSERAWREDLERLDRPINVVEKVVQMGRRVTPGHEAIWAFVRGCAIGMEGVLRGPDRVGVLEMVQEYMVELEGKEGTEAEKLDFMTLKRYTRMIEHLQIR